MDGVAYTILATAKLFCLYYYYKDFNYPWHVTPCKLDNDYQLNDIKFYNKMIILLLISTMSVDIASNATIPQWKIIIIWNVWKLLHLYPLYVSECVVAVIFCKYAIYIKQLTKKIGTVKSAEIFEEYKRIHVLYKVEYCGSLKYQINLMFIGIFIWLWADTYRIVSQDNKHNIGSLWILRNILWAVSDVLTYAMVLVPAIILAESFNKFESRLWEKSEKVMNGIDENDEIGRCNYVINSVRKYPLDGKVFGITFTKRKVTNLIISFVAAKLVSYSIKYF